MTLAPKLKTLFFRFTYSFKEKNVCRITVIMSFHNNKGKKNDTFKKKITAFQGSDAGTSSMTEAAAPSSM
jgi:hypothetical protein